MKTKYSINSGNSVLPKGLERIEKIDILEDNSIIILYTVNDDFMEENELFYKNRILKLDPSKNEEYLAIMDYANIMGGENNEK